MSFIFDDDPAAAADDDDDDDDDDDLLLLLVAVAASAPRLNSVSVAAARYAVGNVFLDQGAWQNYFRSPTMPEKD